jgi:hypothetical protein
LSNPIISKLESAAHNQSFVCISHYSISPARRFSPNSLEKNQEEAKEAALTQLLYLTSLSKGLSAPEPDVLDLDASFDDTLVKDQGSRIVEDERIVEMRGRLGRTIESTARVWGHDLEVVSVRTRTLQWTYSIS